MATITRRVAKRGRVRYRVEVRRRGGRYVSATLDSLAEARVWAREAERDARRDIGVALVDGARRTVGDMFQRYERFEMSRKAVKTQKTQRGQIRWWVDRLGDVALVDLNAGRVRELLDELAERTSTATANRYFAVLSHACAVAVRDWKWMDISPVSQWNRYPEPPGRVRCLSIEEQDALLKACRESTCAALYPIVVLLLATGARRSEISGLSWRDVYLDKGVIVLDRTKNKTRRTLYLEQHSLSVLRTWKSQHNDSLVFGSSIESAWRYARSSAGLCDFRMHDLRHTWASRMAMAGHSIQMIAESLGHRQLSMVQRYAHLIEGYKRGEITATMEPFMRVGVL